MSLIHFTPEDSKEDEETLKFGNVIRKTRWKSTSRNQLKWATISELAMTIVHISGELLNEKIPFSYLKMSRFSEMKSSQKCNEKKLKIIEIKIWKFADFQPSSRSGGVTLSGSSE